MLRYTHLVSHLFYNILANDQNHVGNFFQSWVMGSWALDLWSALNIREKMKTRRVWTYRTESHINAFILDGTKLTDVVCFRLG